MSKNKKIKFIKVEAERPLLTFYTPKYEAEARLYLELLENKSKVKPHIRNTEWISSSSKGSVPSIYEAKDYADNEITKENLISKSPAKSPREKPKIIDITNASDKDIKDFEDRALRSRDDRRDDRRDDLENISGSIKFGFKQKLKEQRSMRSSRENYRDDDRRSDRDNDDRRSDRDNDDKRSDRDNDKRSDRDNDRRSDREESALSKMLKGESSSITTSEKSDSINTTTSTVQNTVSNIINSNETSSAVIPPSISEINEGKVHVDTNGVRSLDYITKDEKAEEDVKKDLLVKFNILKKKHPYATISTYSEHTDLTTLQKDYKSVVKQIEVEAKAIKYKTWLLWGYFGLEFILLNYASFDDIRGFYQQQYNSMNQYEDLLYELGEKTYIPDEKKWPVEIRLLMLIGTNAGMFILGKMAEKRFGINPMNMFKTAPNYSQPSQESQQAPPSISSTQVPPKKKGISAPEFDFEDISQKKTN